MKLGCISLSTCAKTTQEGTRSIRVLLKPHCSFAVPAHVQLWSTLESLSDDLRRRVTSVPNEGIDER